MNAPIDHATLHRGAKYFMDSGRAESHDAAMALLQKFGLVIQVGEEVAHSAAHQIALLTLVNITRRTFLGGVAVAGLTDAKSVTSLAPDGSVRDAVIALGGSASAEAPSSWPIARIGTVAGVADKGPVWQVTWDGWRGGVCPAELDGRLAEGDEMLLAPALAAAVCAAEAFSYHAGDHPLAGRRAAGLSLWNPAANWLTIDTTEPPLQMLPSRLWVIGLGNLGQAFAWLLGCLPYQQPADLEIVLQDFDRLAPSNESTSLLSYAKDTGKMKARMVAEWLDQRGFTTMIEERRFGSWTQRQETEPGVALCGVDNALARTALDKAGFGLIVEAGLGGGTQGFPSLGVHTFPSSRTPAEIWSKQVVQGDASAENMPAYQALKNSGMDACGLTQLATRTVGVPFVGLIAGCMVFAELLRRLHGGEALEFITGSVSALEDLEAGPLIAGPYAFGFCKVIQQNQ
jgi:hypothetical protein